MSIKEILHEISSIFKNFENVEKIDEKQYSQDIIALSNPHNKNIILFSENKTIKVTGATDDLYFFPYGQSGQDIIIDSLGQNGVVVMTDDPQQKIELIANKDNTHQLKMGESQALIKYPAHMKYIVTVAKSDFSVATQIFFYDRDTSTYHDINSINAEHELLSLASYKVIQEIAAPLFQQNGATPHHAQDFFESFLQRYKKSIVFNPQKASTHIDSSTGNEILIGTEAHEVFDGGVGEDLAILEYHVTGQDTLYNIENIIILMDSANSAIRLGPIENNHCILSMGYATAQIIMNDQFNSIFAVSPEGKVQQHFSYHPETKTFIDPLANPYCSILTKDDNNIRIDFLTERAQLRGDGGGEDHLTITLSEPLQHIQVEYEDDLLTIYDQKTGLKIADSPARQYWKSIQTQWNDEIIQEYQFDSTSRSYQNIVRSNKDSQLIATPQKDLLIGDPSQKQTFILHYNDLSDQIIGASSDDQLIIVLQNIDQSIHMARNHNVFLIQNNADQTIMHFDTQKIPFNITSEYQHHTVDHYHFDPTINDFRYLVSPSQEGILVATHKTDIMIPSENHQKFVFDYIDTYNDLINNDQFHDGIIIIKITDLKQHVTIVDNKNKTASLLKETGEILVTFPGNGAIAQITTKLDDTIIQEYQLDTASREYQNIVRPNKDGQLIATPQKDLLIGDPKIYQTFILNYDDEADQITHYSRDDKLFIRLSDKNQKITIETNAAGDFEIHHQDNKKHATKIIAKNTPFYQVATLFEGTIIQDYRFEKKPLNHYGLIGKADSSGMLEGTKEFDILEGTPGKNIFSLSFDNAYFDKISGEGLPTDKDQIIITITDPSQKIAIEKESDHYCIISDDTQKKTLLAFPNDGSISEVITRDKAKDHQSYRFDTTLDNFRYIVPQKDIFTPHFEGTSQADLFIGTRTDDVFYLDYDDITDSIENLETRDNIIIRVKDKNQYIAIHQSGQNFTITQRDTGTPIIDFSMDVPIQNIKTQLDNETLQSYVYDADYQFYRRFITASKGHQFWATTEYDNLNCTFENDTFIFNFSETSKDIISGFQGGSDTIIIHLQNPEQNIDIIADKDKGLTHIINHNTKDRLISFTNDKDGHVSKIATVYQNKIHSDDTCLKEYVFDNSILAYRQMIEPDLAHNVYATAPYDTLIGQENQNSHFIFDLNYTKNNRIGDKGSLTKNDDIILRLKDKQQDINVIVDGSQIQIKDTENVYVSFDQKHAPLLTSITTEWQGNVMQILIYDTQKNSYHPMALLNQEGQFIGRNGHIDNFYGRPNIEDIFVINYQDTSDILKNVENIDHLKIVGMTSEDSIHVSIDKGITHLIRKDGQVLISFENMVQSIKTDGPEQQLSFDPALKNYRNIGKSIEGQLTSTQYFDNLVADANNNMIILNFTESNELISGEAGGHDTLNINLNSWGQRIAFESSVNYISIIDENTKRHIVSMPHTLIQKNEQFIVQTTYLNNQGEKQTSQEFLYINDKNGFYNIAQKSGHYFFVGLNGETHNFVKATSSRDIINIQYDTRHHNIIELFDTQNNVQIQGIPSQDLESLQMKLSNKKWVVSTENNTNLIEFSAGTPPEKISFLDSSYNEFSTLQLNKDTQTYEIVMLNWLKSGDENIFLVKPNQEDIIAKGGHDIVKYDISLFDKNAKSFPMIKGFNDTSDRIEILNIKTPQSIQDYYVEKSDKGTFLKQKGITVIGSENTYTPDIWLWDEKGFGLIQFFYHQKLQQYCGNVQSNLRSNQSRWDGSANIDFIYNKSTQSMTYFGHGGSDIYFYDFTSFMEDFMTNKNDIIVDNVGEENKIIINFEESYQIDFLNFKVDTQKSNVKINVFGDDDRKTIAFKANSITSILCKVPKKNDFHTATIFTWNNRQSTFERRDNKQASLTPPASQNYEKESVAYQRKGDNLFDFGSTALFYGKSW